MADHVHVENGLMWQRLSDRVERTQTEAFQYCQQLTLAGYRDWRLPSLQDFRALGTALEPAQGDFWTSTSEPRISERVAYIDDGTTMFRTNKYLVRAVRGV